MADFLLFSTLPSILLEQIIGKLDWKSYFRLQQTCRKMEEFVRSNRKLYTRVDKNANFKWHLDENGEHQLLLQFSTGTVDISSVYGIQLKVLAPPRHMETDFSEFCEALETHRITCSHLCLHPCPGGFELTKEHCIELIMILKPEDIQMNSENSNRCEALVYSRDLEKLSLTDPTPSQIASAMENIIRYRHVELFVSYWVSTSPEELSTALISINQVLRSVTQIHGNLQTLMLRIFWNPDIYHQLTNNLKMTSSALMVEKVQEETSGTRYYLSMPGQSSCHIITEPRGLTFIYRQDAVEQ